MTDRLPQPGRNEEDERGAMTSSRPIPDGGLGAAMPDWLQQAPSWKRAPQLPPVRKTPAPDTSEIDPGRLIDIDDLPEWLQAVSSRGIEQPERTDVSPVVEQAVQPVPETVAITPTAADDALAPAPPATPEPLPTDLATRQPTKRHEPVRLLPSPTDGTRPWWLSDAAVAVLFAAIVLTMTYVILVASGIM